MWETNYLVPLCYVVFMQISFINTKSQLFTLKNNQIVMFNQNPDIFDKNTETFYIISSTADEKNGNFWVKDDGDNYEFAFDSLPE